MNSASRRNVLLKRKELYANCTDAWYKTILHCVSKKGATFIFAITLAIMYTDFNDSFAVVLPDLLLRKVVLKRPPHLKSVAALPCET